MPKFKKFRVAVSGSTVDGRTIDDKMLREMAEDYKPATYGARINMEHIRGYSPDGPFNAYGDVTALSVEEVDVEIGGNTERRLALFAEGEGLDNLVELTKKGQKVYPSIEIEPNFAGKGRAYLMGLAITDSPASLGTERLQFTLNEIKARANRLFSTGLESDIAFEDETPPATSFADQFRAFLDKFSQGGQQQVETPAEPVTPPVQAPAAAPAADGQFAALMGMMGALTTSLDQSMKAQAEETRKVREEFAALQGQINNTQNPNHHSRPLSNGSALVKTDC